MMGIIDKIARGLPAVLLSMAVAFLIMFVVFISVVILDSLENRKLAWAIGITELIIGILLFAYYVGGVL